MLRLGPITPSGPFDRLFDEVQQDLQKGVREIQRVFGQPDANFAEYEDRYELEMAVPGLDKEDLDVSVRDGIISVSAEAKKLIESDSDSRPRYKFREFGFSGFKRTFSIPRDAKIDGTTARCEKGVLFVVIPRLTDADSLSISID